MCSRNKLLLLGVPVGLALAGSVNAQNCSASDNSYIYSQPICSGTANTYDTQWDLWATWNDNDGGETYEDYFGTTEGEGYCTADHTSCSGQQVSSQQLNATESFMSEPVGDDDVQFAWTITNKEPSFTYCANGQYNEAENDFPTTDGWFDEYCN